MALPIGNSMDKNNSSLLKLLTGKRMTYSCKEDKQK